MLNQVLCLLHSQLSLGIYEDDSIGRKASPTFQISRGCLWMRQQRQILRPLYKKACHKALLCCRTERFEDQEGFVQGWSDCIELLKVSAAGPRSETRHQLCDRCSPTE